MKFLLIQPNCTEEINKEYLSLQYPINLGSIAAVLKKQGHEVNMVDFNVMSRKRLGFFISKFKPELIGVTALTSSIPNAEKIISEIKKLKLKLMRLSVI